MDDEKFRKLYKYSLDWKRISHKLIEEFWDSDEKLKYIVWSTLDMASAFGQMDSLKSQIVNWIVSNRDFVKAGILDIENCPKFLIGTDGRKTGFPSALSKFCHIVNPQKYKFIWDNNFSIFVGNELGKGDMYAKSHWKEVCRVMERMFNLDDVASPENITIWDVDSKIWAYIKWKNKEENN